MKNFFKIAIRILPIFATLVLAYILYLNFYGDRTENNWFGRRYTKADIKAQSKKANDFADNFYLQLSAETEYSETSAHWPNISYSAAELSFENAKKALKYINDSIRNESLDSLTLFKIRKLEHYLKEKISGFRFFNLEYTLNQIDGCHIQLFNLLNEKQQIKSLDDANLYLAKLKNLPIFIEQIQNRLKNSQTNNSLPPRYLFRTIINQLNVLGADIQTNTVAKKNIILTDFEYKLNKITIESGVKKQLKDSCLQMLKNDIYPALTALNNYLKSIENEALNSPGIWKHKDGEDYYVFLVKKYSGSDLSPNSIYDLGNEEISRIQKEISEILKKQDINISLQEYISKLKYNPNFYYPNTTFGDNSFIGTLKKSWNQSIKNCAELYENCPGFIFDSILTVNERKFNASKLIVSDNKMTINPLGFSIPTFMAEAYSSFYIFPGKYYLLKNVSTQKECKNHPAFYDGWALYATAIGDKLGLYTDPQNQLGRLFLELWHACHLVADVGLHSKRWTREQTLQFYRSKTVFGENDINYMVDYIAVHPAKSISAKIGMLTITELLEKTKKALDNQFEIKEFHQLVLKNGCMPISFLEDLVDDYLKGKKTKK